MDPEGADVGVGVADGTGVAAAVGVGVGVGVARAETVAERTKLELKSLELKIAVAAPPETKVIRTANSWFENAAVPVVKLKTVGWFPSPEAFTSC